MLTNKQVGRLHEERNRIIRFCQELREMADEAHTYEFRASCHSAADALMEGCFMIDVVLLEGSAKEKEE